MADSGLCALGRGVTPRVLGQLAKLGITSLNQLVLHLPSRYLDETHITPIEDVRVGLSVLIEGEIRQIRQQRPPRKSLVCTLEDVRGGLIHLRFLHFYPGLVTQLREGRRIRALGEPRQGSHGLEMVHPQVKVIVPGEALRETLTAVYPTVAGLRQQVLRGVIDAGLHRTLLDEVIPASCYRSLGLPDFASSLEVIHHPPPDAVLTELERRTHPAWRRLVFDELLAQQLSLRLYSESRRKQGAVPLPFTPARIEALLTRLPFRLTAAQSRVWQEISQDLTQPCPMQRLLQGDVGSGKTILSALAAVQTIENGKQVAIMVPTEILAEQHYRKMTEWLTPLGIAVYWLFGAQPKSQRKAVLEEIACGHALLVVGTHALFQDKVELPQLALVIIDEQHRFGVQQRLALHQKGKQPHQLMMSATPIPRTLAMSYYADLDVSVIDEMPAGRVGVVTRLVSDVRREVVITHIRQFCTQSGQAYWVCPLIEESEALQLQTVLELYATLQRELPEVKIGLVHGRMKSAEKQQVMEAFSAGETRLLVATTVIEVGVDVPNATLIVIEHAERMGLSQLHQLRGRVGRGAAEGTCILLYHEPITDLAKARLKIIFESTDGFEIAQADLALRGHGEFLGVKQSGTAMLKFADLEVHQDLIEAARDTAVQLLRQDRPAVERHLQRWLGDSADYHKV